MNISNVLGDEEGFYIGTTGKDQQSVLLNMGTTCRMNQSANAVLWGNLGVGRSFNSNLIMHLNFLNGGYNLIIDAKGERSHWANFPLYKDHIKIVKLSDEDNFEAFNDILEAYDLADSRIIILQIQDLHVPLPPKKGRWSLPYIHPMATITSFIQSFISKNRLEFSLILFDESFLMKGSIEGTNLYNFLSKINGSLNCGCIYIGHSILDIPFETERKAMNYKFCFTCYREEAERALKYLGLEVTADNVELIQNLDNGQCLFQDAFGRTGILTFDAVSQELITLF